MLQSEINQWQKGLSLDGAETITDNQTLTSALNATIITMNGNEPMLQNDMGNAKVESAYLPAGYIPVGMQEFGGIVYITSYNPLTKQSQIGSFPSPERNISSDEVGAPTLELEDFGEENGIGEINSAVRKLRLTQDLLRPGDKYSIEIADEASLIRLIQFISCGAYLWKLATINEAGQMCEIPAEEITVNYYYTIDNNQLSFCDNPTGKIWEDYFALPVLWLDNSSNAIESTKRRQFNVYKQNLIGDLYIILELNIPRSINITNSGSWEGEEPNKVFNWTLNLPTYSVSRNLNVAEVHSSDAMSYYYLGGVVEKTKDDVVLYDISREDTYTYSSALTDLLNGGFINPNGIQWLGPWIKNGNYSYTRTGKFADINVTLTRRYNIVNKTNNDTELLYVSISAEDLYLRNLVLDEILQERIDGEQTITQSVEGNATIINTKYSFPNNLFIRSTVRTVVTNNVPDELLYSECYVLTYDQVNPEQLNKIPSDVNSLINEGKYNHVLVSNGTISYLEKLLNSNVNITGYEIFEATHGYYVKTNRRKDIINKYEISITLDNAFYTEQDSIKTIDHVSTNKQITFNSINAGTINVAKIPSTDNYGTATITITPIWECNGNSGKLNMLTKTVTVDLSKLGSNTVELISIIPYANSVAEVCDFDVEMISYMDDNHSIDSVTLKVQDAWYLGEFDGRRKIFISNDAIKFNDSPIFSYVCSKRVSYNNFTESIEMSQDNTNTPINSTHLLDQRVVLLGLDVSIIGGIETIQSLQNETLSLISSTNNNSSKAVMSFEVKNRTAIRTALPEIEWYNNGTLVNTINTYQDDFSNYVAKITAQAPILEESGQSVAAPFSLAYSVSNQIVDQLGKKYIRFYEPVANVEADYEITTTHLDVEISCTVGNDTLTINGSTPNSTCTSGELEANTSNDYDNDQSAFQIYVTNASLYKSTWGNHITIDRGSVTPRFTGNVYKTVTEMFSLGECGNWNRIHSAYYYNAGKGKHECECKSTGWATRANMGIYVLDDDYDYNCMGEKTGGSWNWIKQMSPLFPTGEFFAIATNRNGAKLTNLILGYMNPGKNKPLLFGLPIQDPQDSNKYIASSEQINDGKYCTSFTSTLFNELYLPSDIEKETVGAEQNYYKSFTMDDIYYNKKVTGHVSESLLKQCTFYLGSQIDDSEGNVLSDLFTWEEQTDIEASNSATFNLNSLISSSLLSATDTYRAVFLPTSGSNNQEVYEPFTDFSPTEKLIRKTGNNSYEACDWFQFKQNNSSGEYSIAVTNPEAVEEKTISTKMQGYMCGSNEYKPDVTIYNITRRTS